MKACEAEYDLLLTDPGTIAAIVWLAGMVAIMVYLTVQTIRMMNVLKRKEKQNG